MGTLGVEVRPSEEQSTYNQSDRLEVNFSLKFWWCQYLGWQTFSERKAMRLGAPGKVGAVLELHPIKMQGGNPSLTNHRPHCSQLLQLLAAHLCRTIIIAQPWFFWWTKSHPPWSGVSKAKSPKNILNILLVLKVLKKKSNPPWHTFALLAKPRGQVASCSQPFTRWMVKFHVEVCRKVHQHWIPPAPSCCRHPPHPLH